MDNFLPLYAKIIDSVCPCNHDDFASAFNAALRPALSGTPTKKTLDNHRTEIAGKLFGMYYTTKEGTVYPSERTLKFLSDSDTPAFFKDICFKMQFPNGSQKYQTVQAHKDNGVCIRQFSFVLKVLLLAKYRNISLTKKNIGYYILNSIDVLCGKAKPEEVLKAISQDRKQGVKRTLGSGSHENQHINEQINLLELANLVIVDEDKAVTLNFREMPTIQIFADTYNSKPRFDVYAYDLQDLDVRKSLYTDWDYYFSQLSDKASLFDTTAEALGAMPEVITTPDDTETVAQPNTVEIGDEGERYVYEYEKRRVTAFDFRLAGKVLLLGKTRGLGYDIQSVVAKKGDTSDFVKYIEVKATKRVTAPNITDINWIDTLNVTRNEWVAMQQHRGSYSVFRVYFVRDSVIMFVLTDIAQKCDDGTITAVPTIYRIDFGNAAVDEVIPSAAGSEKADV